MASQECFVDDKFTSLNFPSVQVTEQSTSTDNCESISRHLIPEATQKISKFKSLSLSLLISIWNRFRFLDILLTLYTVPCLLVVLARQKMSVPIINYTCIMEIICSNTIDSRRVSGITKHINSLFPSAHNWFVFWYYYRYTDTRRSKSYVSTHHGGNNVYLFRSVWLWQQHTPTEINR